MNFEWQENLAVLFSRSKVNIDYIYLLFFASQLPVLDEKRKHYKTQALNHVTTY